MCLWGLQSSIQKGDIVVVQQGDGRMLYFFNRSKIGHYAASSSQKMTSKADQLMSPSFEELETTMQNLGWQIEACATSPLLC